MKYSKQATRTIAAIIFTIMMCLTSISSDAAALKTTAASDITVIELTPVVTSAPIEIEPVKIEKGPTPVVKKAPQATKTVAKKALPAEIIVMDTCKTTGPVDEPIEETAYEPYYTVTDDELEMLYRITEAEATGGTVEQKINVVSCVFARYESNEWPNTIKDVIFQKSQFSPIDDGRYYTVKITDETRDAVNYVIENGKQHNYIFFCSYGCKSNWFARKDAALAAKGEEPYRDGIHRYYLE